MTESEYEIRSLDAFTEAWAEYEGEEWDDFERDFRESRAYYIDDDLVIAITDTFRRRFISCFHEHPGRRHTSRAIMPSVGQRRLDYRSRFENARTSGLIRNSQRIRGV
jgi:hypothetical protein